MKRISLLMVLTFAALFVLAQRGVSTKNGVTLGPGISAKLKEKNAALVMILTYRSPDAATAARKLLLDKGIKFVGPEFKELPIQGIKAAVSDLDWITKIKGAYGIWENQSLKGDLHQAVIVSRVKNVREDAAFTALNGGLPITGRGVGVLVNDSGFDGDSTDLQESDGVRGPRRIVQNVKGLAVEWQEDHAADNGVKRDSDEGGGHGSHCMGIVGGDGRYSNGKYTGVAPGAYLIGYGSGAGLNILDVAGGFEYVLRHGRDYNIRVMSNSYGSTADTTFNAFSPTNPTSVATKSLSDRGVMVVFSSGNSGPRPGTITGNFKVAPWVVNIANGQKDGTLASSSSRGRPQGGNINNNEAEQGPVTVDGKSYLFENRPTLTAPGTDIVSVRATTGITGVTSLPDDAMGLSPTEVPFYSILSGTSMACPHIAGVVALMMEANPNLEWRAVKAILQRTAVPMQNKKWEAGTGYVNAHAAVAAAYYGLLNTTATDYNSRYGLPADGSFGFATEAWKTAALHPEVQSRMASTVPNLADVQSECGPGVPPITDAVGAADVNPNPPAPQYDIETVNFSNETAATFDITMKVFSGLAAVPPGVTGVQQRYFDVHFTLDKITDEMAVPNPNIAYIVSSFDEAGVKRFKLTVRSNDGTTRPTTNIFHYEDITGVWNTTNNTITWTVPKAKLNVSSPPATTAAAGTRTSRAARAGDRLKDWRAFTYERAGTTTPDGAGVYSDRAAGQCFKVLAQ